MTNTGDKLDFMQISIRLALAGNKISRCVAVAFLVVTGSRMFSLQKKKKIKPKKNS